MKTCINGATTMPYPLEKDVESAGEAGFQGIEIWKNKLDDFLKTKGTGELRRLLSDYNLGVPAICAFGGYIWCSEEEFEKKVEDTERYFEVASKIDCYALIVCSEGFNNRSVEEAVAAHAKRLARLAEVGKHHGVRIAMEWFWNQRDAFEVIERADHEYLGVIIDTFHWYRGDGNLNNLDIIPRDKLYLVHINDCEDLPRRRLTDKNRLHCGLGVIPLVDILCKFKRIDYQGYLSVEIFRDEYWMKDPLTINREALYALKTTMKRASVL
jgi:2-keto-myo-inositol isomerase